MKKKYLLAFLFSMICFFVIAQNKSNSCKFNFSANAFKCSDEVSNGEKFVTLNWDFSKIKNIQDIKIEVMPIRDCFNDLAATSFKDTIVFIIDNQNINYKDTKILFHKEMMAKCFKWRVVVKAADCTEISDWVYYSFIGNK